MWNRASIYILLTFTAIIQSCQPQLKDNDTWLVGKIDNPIQDYIVIKHYRITLDTVRLDENNYFRYRFNKPVKEGMYSFVHEDPHYFYIAPGDSLLFLSNTIDFEGSIFFSNDHGAENNLLTKLNNRIKNDNIPHTELSELSIKDFEKILAARKKENEKIINNFKNRNQHSTKVFNRIVKGVVEQDYLLNRERYIQAHKVYDSKNDSIPESFLEYRESITFDKDTMEVYYPYYRLLLTYFDNKVLENFSNKEEFDVGDFELNKRKIELIDEEVDNSYIKNFMLYITTRTFLLHSKDSAEGNQVLSLHNKLSSCPISQDNLADLNVYTTQLKPGSQVPNLRVLNHNNSIVQLQNIIKQPTILFFWSSRDIQHQKNIHTRAKELKSKYPEYRFIGINTDHHFKNWRKEIDKLGYDSSNEFQFYEPDIGKKELVITSKNKVIILDSNGFIRNGHANIYQRTIENELLQYLN